jgi:Na+-transporting NADH:ubiquinone oxidoreductase subunit C
VLVCLACSIVVSAAAVFLRPQQQINKQLDIQKNILQVAGLLDDDDIQALYKKHVEVRIVDLETGEFTDAIDPATYNARDAARNPATSIALGEQDIAGIKRRARYASVYLIKDNGETKYLVLPVHGYGLWSTLYGFIALKNDYNTVYGIGFYAHAETPGLGGEVDNPNWKALWQGKKIFDDGEPTLALVKGHVTPETPDAEHKIDALAGATLTTRGVENMVRFWFGEQGYQPFLNNLKSQRG